MSVCGGGATSMRAVFVTGTDTGVGKTHVAAALLRALVARGAGAVGMKPVAAGIDADGTHADVVALRAAGNVDAPQDEMNPYCFAPAIAPHVAARLAARERAQRLRQGGRTSRCRRRLHGCDG